MNTSQPRDPSNPYNFPEPDISLDDLENDRAQIGEYTVTRSPDAQGSVVRIQGPQSTEFRFTKDQTREAIDAYDQAVHSIGIYLRNAQTRPEITSEYIVQQVGEEVRELLKLPRGERKIS